MFFLWKSVLISVILDVNRASSLSKYLGWWGRIKGRDITTVTTTYIQDPGTYALRFAKITRALSSCWQNEKSLARADLRDL